jgi:hypothetical protein
MPSLPVGSKAARDRKNLSVMKRNDAKITSENPWHSCRRLSGISASIPNPRRRWAILDHLTRVKFSRLFSEGQPAKRAFPMLFWLAPASPLTYLGVAELRPPKVRRGQWSAVGREFGPQNQQDDHSQLEPRPPAIPSPICIWEKVRMRGSRPDFTLIRFD